MGYTCAEVHILDMPYKADRAYEYFLPVTLRQNVRAGSFVTVPFGNGNRRQTGIVTGLFDGEERERNQEIAAAEKKTNKSGKSKDISRKPVLSVFPESCSLDSEMLEVCRFMRDMTLCTMGDAVRAVIPPTLLSYAELFYTASDKGTGSLAATEDAVDLLGVYGYIKDHGGAFLGNLRMRFGERVLAVLERLEAKKFISSSTEIRGAAKTKRYVRLALDDEMLSDLRGGSLKLRSPKQIRFLEILDNGGGYMPLSDILEKDDGLSRSQLDSLEKGGYVVSENVEVRRNPCINVNVGTPPKYELSVEQSEALSKLTELYEDADARAALLLGVTGSGKTAVMIKTIDRVVSDGKGVIVLLPEIALTPQMMGIFCSYYGDRVAVMHSGLSAGERLDTYNYIKEGKADIVVGTRSAIFAPVKDLGMIIIDEEQEHTYKSDVSPKYHARDIARFRCAKSRALMLLMSATPSIDSYAKAVEGKYTLITLTQRYGGAVLPSVTVADMRRETQSGNVTPFGKELVNALCETYAAGEQSVLFINRRGYHNFMSCKSCGEALLCPSCSVSLTYHKNSFGDGYLCCHWCGHREPVPKKCPSCGSEHLSFTGYGTQHIEEDLQKLIPGVRILRMDTDTTGTKQAYDDILGRFRRHEADILLGTQMVTKGHDFADVTLVGVLLADMSLYVDDYRAAERTFSMLTQVIGRAGRAKKPGRAVIQTNNPDNDIIKLAREQDYLTFARNELRVRRSLVFPPYCDIVLFTVSGSDEAAVQKQIAEVRERLSELTADKYNDVKTVVFGPFEAPVYRVDKKYRMRVVVKCRLNKRARACFSELLVKCGGGGAKAPSLSVDFNPSNL